MVRAGVIRKIKMAKSYSYSELATITGRCEATVRGWAKDDMRVLTDCKPHLILGSDARAYLEKRFHTKRPKLKIGEARCFTCQEIRMLEIGLAEILPRHPSGQSLCGLCSVCGGMCSRWISERDMPFHAKKLGIDLNTGIQP